MTQIQKIVMNGFKSFAQKTELILGTKFNCVLGPNGSGKSNIMDALSFVLGKGSAKGMRAEKAANLIYNGGKAKTPAKQGEVSIYFDNEDKTFPTDEKSVKITRIVKNSGQSVYKINDKTRTRQQILDLLSVANINPDGYNIILQGDIVRFVEMSPDERRKIIEEISGISVYEEKKKKAENELRKVEEKLNEAEIILSERKTHLEELKSERDQAFKYKDLNEKLTRSRATLLNIQIKSKESQVKKINDNMQSYTGKIEKFQKEIDEYQKKINDMKNEERNINNEIESKGEKEQVDLHKEVEQLKIDIATNKARISSCENELTRLEQRKNQLSKNTEDISSKISVAEKEKQSQATRKKEKLEQLKQVEDKIKKYREDNQLDNAGNIEKDIDALDKNIDKKQHEIQELREDQQELTRNKDRIEFQIQNIDEKVLKVKEVEKEYKKEIEELKKDREELKKVTLTLSKELDQNQAVVAQTTNARVKLEKAREELAAVNAKNNVAKQAVAGSIAVQKILENKNKFGKVYGTVTELGSVKSKYSQALEVAAGPRIRSIVVEDDKTASECIKYLKANRLGSATFLPLNKIKGQITKPEIKKLLNAKGVHGLANDLISYDPKFNKIFSYVFGNTLIVDDIDTARRIGVGTARMTTITGDMTELSGAMHGGFRDKKPGIGFKEKEVMLELKELEKKKSDYQNLLTTLENKRETSEKTINELREKKANLEGDVIKKEKSLHLDSDDLKASMKVKEEFNKELIDVDKKLMTVQNSVSTINSELANLKIQRQKLRDQVGELRNPKKLAELNAFQQKKDELKEELIKIDAEIKNIDVQISNIYSPEKDNTSKILKQHDKEEENFKEEIKLLKETIKKQNEELKIKNEKEKVFRSLFKSLFEKRNKINEEIRKTEEKLGVKDKQIREVEIKSNSFSVENARFKAELSALQEEFKQYENVDLLNHTKETLKENIRKYDIMLGGIGSVNMKALEIYDAVEKEYHNLMEKKDGLRLEKEDVMMMMNEIETKKKDLFMKSFDIINNNFQEKFKLLSTKGDAYLELEAPEDPLSAGVLIKVRISGKKFLDIRSLSGGEKTMTALAFIFSIQENNPASFYILDEVDAALDKRNAEKLADLVKQYSVNAQYLIISHNDGVISEADTLYGVSMNEHGMSKIVSLKV